SVFERFNLDLLPLWPLAAFSLSLFLPFLFVGDGVHGSVVELLHFLVVVVVLERLHLSGANRFVVGLLNGDECGCDRSGGNVRHGTAPRLVPDSIERLLCVLPEPLSTT